MISTLYDVFLHKELPFGVSVIAPTLKFLGALIFLQQQHNTCLTALCPGLPGWAGTTKVKPIKRQLVAVASAGPYASLHLALDRYLHQHPTTQFFRGRMPFLPPIQQCRSTEGKLINSFDRD